MSWILALAIAASAATSTNPQLAIGLDEHVGVQVPRDLAFSDTTGRLVTLGSYFDGHRPVVLVLAYAHCRMLCSVVLHAVADAIVASKQAVGRDYLPVVVSIDPNESPQTAAHRQDLLLDEIHHPGQRALWPYLIGDQPTIAKLASTLGFRYVWDPKTEQFAHPAVVFLLTPKGKIAEYLRGVAFPDFDEAVTRARDGTQTSSTTSDILRCFHFDPSLRRYGHAMQMFLRFGATTVLVALGAMIAVLVIVTRRRRRGGRP